jgi:hypothetical protein
MTTAVVKRKRLFSTAEEFALVGFWRVTAD